MNMVISEYVTLLLFQMRPAGKKLVSILNIHSFDDMTVVRAKTSKCMHMKMRNHYLQ